MSEWPQVPLGTVVNLKRGFDLPADRRQPGRFPVVSSGGVSGFHHEARCEAPGVVIGRYGSIGSVHWVSEPYWPLNTSLFVEDFKGNDPRFVFYLLQTINYHAHSDKSSVPGVNRNDLHMELVSLPPLPEQRAIAEVLGALDDKIELNEGMNATLDEMARALFKSWFVDFDPVRAKAEGREPSHMDAATAGLFPDSFEDSALGPIPAGWRVSTVGDVVSVFGGSTPSTKEPAFWDGSHAFATPKDLSKISTPVLLDTARRITDAGLAKVSSGLLPADTVLMSSRAPVGYLAIARLPVAVNQGMAAMVCDGDVKPPFVLNWTRLNMDEIRSRASGTTFPEIGKSSFRSIQCVVPPREVHDAYHATMSPLYDLITTNVSESRTLTELRDTLLPRLISGQLRVEAPARIVERAC
ncbi:MAG: hypothetical protein AMXMBFR23_02800 [Chloroflexota bacterium]